VRRAAKRKKQKNFPTKKKPEKSVDDPSRLIEAAEVRFFSADITDESRKSVPRGLNRLRKKSVLYQGTTSVGLVND
jgi:hypothetical protein